MLLRSESDFIWVTNASHDLSGIVTAYIKLFRKYINGHNNLFVPGDKFAVTFFPSTKEGYIKVGLWWTEKYSVEVPIYYDVDDYNFSESWGSDNTCGIEIQRHDAQKQLIMEIPIKHLMQTENQMEKYFIAYEKKIISDQAEYAKQERIKALETELRKLQKD